MHRQCGSVWHELHACSTCSLIKVICNQTVRVDLSMQWSEILYLYWTLRDSTFVPVVPHKQQTTNRIDKLYTLEEFVEEQARVQDQSAAPTIASCVNKVWAYHKSVASSCICPWLYAVCS
jgi:hypothetical protein